MTRYLCIHGHFYQPPRENPWLETVEIQDSAQPYHDWNARITAECYAPNGAARIMGSDGLISHIVNNYEHISFNIGPTLASWIERYQPDAWQLIQLGDAASVQDHHGHGNAIAQVYNHMILPLASQRDKRTQVVWGIRDFEYRFGRRPEGMWLAETAADRATLRALADQGIKFTILAPNQCARVRPMGQSKWTELPSGAVDPRQPYRVNVGDGKHVDVFFYDGMISKAVAFENLLTDGERYARRLLDGFVPTDDDVQLVNIATDGESYGHHTSHGEMALAYGIQVLRKSDVKLTNYGEFLAEHPPRWECEIHEPSSWSCVHGVGRWSSNCGCTSRGDWHQHWRAPLRAALDWLRDAVDPLYERKARPLFKQPWEARDAYIDVVVNRTPERLRDFLEQQCSGQPDPAQRVQLLKLLEMQRHRMLMYTSCGWFFDDISRIEGVQILQYAARVIQLARDLGLDVEAEFVDRLSRAPSNVPEFINGRGVWEHLVSGAFVDLRRVIAHYAIQSLVDGHAQQGEVFSYQVQPLDYHREVSGHTGFALGRARVISAVTTESLQATFAVVHFGGQDFHCSIGDKLPDDFEAVRSKLSRAYQRQSMTDLLRCLDREFGEDFYTIKDLLADERRRILLYTLQDVLQRYDSSYRNLFDQSIRTIQLLVEIGTPPPVELLAAASYVVRTDLERALAHPQNGNLTAAMTALRRARKWGIPLDRARLEMGLRHSLETQARSLLTDLEEETIDRIGALLSLADAIPLDVVLWETQNIVNDALHLHAPRQRLDPKLLDLLVGLARRVKLNPAPILEACRSPVAA